MLAASSGTQYPRPSRLSLDEFLYNLAGAAFAPVRRQMSSKPGIDERTLEFSVAGIRFAKTITPAAGTRHVVDQLAGATGSVAANRQEATGASSRREFIRYNEIALRSAKESVVWLSTCDRAGLGDATMCRELLDEARQIVRILAAIVVSTKRGDQ